MLKLIKWFDFPDEDEISSVSSFAKLTSICFDCDDKFHVTIIPIADRSNSKNSSYGCVWTTTTWELIESQLATMGLESYVESILITRVERMITGQWEGVKRQLRILIVINK